jgi:hypothetical protein
MENVRVTVSLLGNRLHDKRFWLAAGTAILVLAGLGWWGRHSYRRGQARDALNSFAPFQRPPLDIQFPEVLAASARNREILQAGVRNGIWTLHQHGSNPNAMEVLLTSQGQRWFSVVERQIVATFIAGNREATEVLAVNEIFPSRQIRFRYRWKEFHPASAAVLGQELPAVGKEYAGDAVLFYENNRWRLMQWDTPEFDAAVARFKGLEPAPE